MARVRLTIGDWSEDGHGQSEDFIYNANKTVDEIRQGYKDSCLRTGVQFNHNENYTGLQQHSSYGTELHICTEYGDSFISDEARAVLTKSGIELGKYLEGDYIGVEEFAELILDFIKISIPDLTWEEASFKKSELESIDPINGWWNDELNVQFGYGLFD